MIRLLIFDLDGTLFDTTPALQEAGNEALGLLGLSPLTRAQYAETAGGSVRGFVEAVLDRAGDPAHRFADAFWDLYLPRLMVCNRRDDANVPYPGIRELILAARQKGVLLAVLSNKDQQSVTDLVGHFFGAENFAITLGHSPDRPPKPDPAGIRYILETLGVANENALYVGDTEVDMETARNAGVPAAGAVWGYRARAVLEAFHPAYLPETPFDLISALS